MPSTTRGFRYPLSSDDVDVPGDLHNLADDIQTELDGTLQVGAADSTGSVWVDHGGSGAKLFFGAAADVGLSRYAAGNVRSDGILSAAGEMRATSLVRVNTASDSTPTANTVIVGYANGGAAPGVSFGSALDASLRRTNTGELTANGDLIVGDDLTVTDDATVSGDLAVTGTINGQTLSASPYFRAYRAGAVSLVSGAVVVFDTDDGDPNNWYDTTSGKFQPTRAGRYHLTWQVAANAALTADKYWQSDAQKNGATGNRGQVCYQRGSTIAATSVGAAQVALNGTTDYMQILIRHDVGSATALNPDSGMTYFAAHYLGA